ncbi:shikimate dehydrogenase [Streptomyces sp. APSN-46.1]|uniref:shikimate dehydrogenase family protein n=1 Tax=Streptomyces sp. APSN-46.1 TaxID=2929049 RepID=UPI001FB24BEE|nr:shikimate dehydrogenase [Streptomyces sp. APSN-46.1]MCJ1678346.1 shikimate dehydrogenase [Streptomyces sp. APSN-46.1]
MTNSVATSIRITGKTRLFAVLGDPVAQVRAPEMLNPVFSALGIDAVLVPVQAPVGSLGEVVRGLQRSGNVDGLFITVPHKDAVRRFADVCSPAVELAGSANVMRRGHDGRWYAENFDGAGFVSGLVASGYSPAARRVVLVGAGGAGSAIAAALMTAGVARLDVCDLDAGRVKAVVDRLRRHWPDRIGGGPTADLGAADIVVNATPLGLRPGDPLPFGPQELTPGTLVADIIMTPRETELLRVAAGLGLPVHHGHHMLEHQLHLYRGFFGLDRAPSRAGTPDPSQAGTADPSQAGTADPSQAGDGDRIAG